ncbi:TPA: hypothetical protein ACHGRL_004248 [Escherichia coli]
MLVFGNTVEPGGMELDDDTYMDKCPVCGELAKHRFYERGEGSVNTYQSITCSHCGYHEDDGED